MKEARTAIDQARLLHADRSRRRTLSRLRKAWDHAQTAEKEGQTSTAKVLYTSAKIYFGKAADIARSKQDALTRELDAMQLMISKNFDQVKIDLSKNKLSSSQRSRVKAIHPENRGGQDGDWRSGDSGGSSQSGCNSEGCADKNLSCTADPGRAEDKVRRTGRPNLGGLGASMSMYCL